MAEASNAWQERCTGELEECIALGAAAGALQWNHRRIALDREAKTLIQPIERARVIIADGKFAKKDLSGFNFQFCYIIRTDFTDANLSSASFDRAIIRQSRLVRADLRGTQFKRCSIDEGTLGWDARIDGRSLLSFTSGAETLGGFGALFRNRAADDHLIEGARTLDNRALRYWYRASDYGRSVTRLIAVFLGVSAMFAILYQAVYAFSPDLFDKGPWTIVDFFLMSVQRFINGPVFFGGHGWVLQGLFTVEAATGYGGLGLLAAVMLRKLVPLR